ncbi:galactosylceramide sulfotransferase-like [Cherax quadricarinatus]
MACSTAVTSVLFLLRLPEHRSLVPLPPLPPPSPSHRVPSVSLSPASAWDTPPTSSSSPASSKKGTCVPHQDLMFLKTHKCASTTTQRIFLRYGKKHRLTWVLPLTGNYLGSPETFRPAMIPRSLRTPDGKYNMMVVHTRFNLHTLSQAMREDAVWVTIVREPVAQFESVWDFFDLQEFYKMTLETFAKLPYKAVMRKRKSRVFGVHQMFFDMGYSTVEDYEPGEMTQKLKRLQNAFDLVMVAERYDESLVLLKNIMCWSTEDVTYLRINHRVHQKKRNMSEETREGLQRLNQADVRLYEFFYQIFEQKVEGFGRDRMRREVEELREANERLARSCVVQKQTANVTEDMDWGSMVKHVAVRTDNSSCVDLVRTEHSMLNDVRKRQQEWVREGWKGYITG